MRFLSKIVIPYRVWEALQAPQQNAMLIMDNFRGQKTDSIMECLEEHNIIVVMVPLRCTDRLQPLDISVNKPTKDILREKFRIMLGKFKNGFNMG